MLLDWYSGDIYFKYLAQVQSVFFSMAVLPRFLTRQDDLVFGQYDVGLNLKLHLKGKQQKCLVMEPFFWDKWIAMAALKDLSKSQRT